VRCVGKLARGSLNMAINLVLMIVKFNAVLLIVRAIGYLHIISTTVIQEKGIRLHTFPETQNTVLDVLMIVKSNIQDREYGCRLNNY
jgi:hypothetical protein